MVKPTRSLEERIADAESLIAYHIGDALEAQECGNLEKARRFCHKSKFWFDRYKLLTRQANRIEPREK